MSARAVLFPHIGGLAARLQGRATRLEVPRRRSVRLDEVCGRALAGSRGRVVTLRWALRNAAAAAWRPPSMHDTDPTKAPYLSRVEAVAALRALGFPATVRTLATLASRGQGPIYRRFGARVLYRHADLLAWAEGRLSAPLAGQGEAG